jgi:hypothetical protein
MESVREILEGEKMVIITQLSRDLEEKCRIIQCLLRHAGQRGFCPRCSERIVFVRHNSSPLIESYNSNGTLHQRTCTKCLLKEAHHGG